MQTNTRKTLLKKALLVSAAVVIAGVGVAYVSVSLWIGSDVKKTAREALRQHKGDRVEALIAYAQSSEHSLRERNRAVWALGQLGDRRALATLTNLRTGRPCDHDSELCQRELAKAIELVEGDLNVTALVWR